MTVSVQDLRLTRFESFEQARESWIRFETGADYHGVQSYAWLRHWHDRVGHRFFTELCIVQAEHADGRPLLLMPLGIKRGLAACLTWLGGDITDYHAPLLGKDYSQIVSDDDFSTIWDEVVKLLPRHDVIDLCKQPERIGPQANPFLNLPGQRDQDVNYWSALSGSWDTFHAEQVKASLRGDSRRKRRRLAEKGQLGFSVARTASDCRRITETMISQKTGRYVDTGTYSLFNDAAYRDFFLAPSEELLQTGMLHVSSLTLGERILATHWGIVFGGRFYFIMASFAGGEWMRLSPGRLLIEDLFRWCFDNGVAEFDFTIGGEEFKKMWSNRSSRLRRYSTSRNLRGSIYLTAERTKDWIRNRPDLHQRISRIRNLIRR